MTLGRSMATLETAYLAARDAHDRLDVVRVRGRPGDRSRLEAEAGAASAAFRSLLAAFGDPEDLEAEDRRALGAMTAGIEAAAAGVLPVAPVLPAGSDDEAARAAAIEAGGETLRRWIEATATSAATALPYRGRTLTRLQILARLATEPDAAERRGLFLALEPLWRSMDGDGVDRSPYRAFLRGSSAAWRAGRSPIAASAVALGVTPADIETWAITVLAAWRAAVVEPLRVRRDYQVEPWDWWWQAGAADRAMNAALPPAVVRALNRDVHAALGADLDALGVELDLASTPTRQPVAMAFTTFGARPRRREDGSWFAGRPTVFANFTEGGLTELLELMHETGHAMHIAAIRTRPAFADWPDSDAFIEGLADLVTPDLTEPAWQRRWLPGGARISEGLAVRGQYAALALDAAWALFEIRLHANPDRLPNDVWTEITSVWLGITRHPEWSWWAMRGQLVEAPGYMANYAIGAVLAAEVRASIREARGDWIDGDPGWYAWVSDHVFRFGLERPTLTVLRDLLGRPPTADAFLNQIGRGAA